MVVSTLSLRSGQYRAQEQSAMRSQTLGIFDLPEGHLAQEASSKWFQVGERQIPSNSDWTGPGACQPSLGHVPSEQPA